MQEPEVSLRIAMHYIESGKTCVDVSVSIDGAHVKTKDVIHFDLPDFMRQNGYTKCDGDNSRWQGEYQADTSLPKIIVSSKPGIGDVAIALNDGRTLYVESKKFKSGSGGEYPAMREAIGQLMTGCPNDSNVIPVVAVPHSAKSESLAHDWVCNTRIRTAGIRFILVREDGGIELI